MNTEHKYFDLHTRGIGYVNRLRTVTPKKGDAFTACTIAALRGSTDSVEYTWFDVRVYNDEAVRLLTRCQEALARQDKVLIAFRIGDICPEIFEYRKGERTGQQGISLKGRLLFISSLYINGSLVWAHETTAPEPAEPQPEPKPEPQPKAPPTPAVKTNADAVQF